MSDPENPFAPPDAPVAPGEVVDEVLDASTGQRLANFFVDSMVSTFLSGGMGAVMAALDAAELAGGLTGMAFSVLLGATYYAVQEGVTGRTIGKYITGTKVVTEDGGRPGWGAVIGRSFARFVPFEPFSFLGGDGRGWHDTWTSTRVVRVRRG